MSSIVVIATCLTSLLVGVVAGYQLIARKAKKELNFAMALQDTIDNFSWSLNMDPFRHYPGKSEPPVLYIMPGAQRSNNCNEARVAWLDKASEMRDYIISIYRGDGRDQQLEARLIASSKSTVDGTVQDHIAELDG